VLVHVQAEAAVFGHFSGGQMRRVGLARSAPELLEMEPTHGPSELMRYLNLLGRPHAISNTRLDPRFSAELDGSPAVEQGPALFAPIRLRAQGAGYVAAYRGEGQPPFGAAEQRTLALLAAWIGASLDGVRLALRLEKLAVTDELTQVFNYRFLKSALRREIKRAARFGQALSVIMLDVDNLKHYNDRHGHLRGSFLLRELAQLLAAQIRSWDLLAKYGGDEFTLILPQTDRGGAMVVAERLREAVEEHAFPLAVKGEITISLGVAVYPDDAQGPSTLLLASDRLLYAAKQAGRNTVVGSLAEAAAKRGAAGS
jgi:diguanylate cyclase (GGDEF)-like protein